MKVKSIIQFSLQIFYAYGNQSAILKQIIFKIKNDDGIKICILMQLAGIYIFLHIMANNTKNNEFKYLFSQFRDYVYSNKNAIHNDFLCQISDSR
ncbi:transmembrane protein, putative (macronuclear) [Tetrahymena thermophila SB210]|uniref:Transmembrane protein, putative n=1 Tax=Tetrahymena thermophila (strain SB210) TaxID=312017 RepID=Q22YI6_TETTS|nr:transmembrane protein, putative [Tetrahymena thermophila SB210]EAR90299.2 transmembrane protein, putative [Tetrahymena thermophila SB210]|eukprot:XP_001010544.2 transmembrane protein, putative [Tetrahymena thermophila SB210]